MVNIGWKTLLMIQQTQIIRDSTQHHIGLGYSEPVPLKAIYIEICFSITKRERMNMHLVRDTIVQTPMIVDDVIHNPCGSRAANYQLDILLSICPSIPKQVQRLNQSGTWCIKTRQFVYKNDNGTILACFFSHHFFQCLKSIIPIGHSLALIATLFE